MTHSGLIAGQVDLGTKTNEVPMVRELLDPLDITGAVISADALHTQRDTAQRPLISSLVTFSIVCGMSVRSTSGRGIANLGWDKIRLLAPVFAGDTLYAESSAQAVVPQAARCS